MQQRRKKQNLTGERGVTKLEDGKYQFRYRYKTIDGKIKSHTKKPFPTAASAAKYGDEWLREQHKEWFPALDPKDVDF